MTNLKIFILLILFWFHHWWIGYLILTIYINYISKFISSE